MENNVEFKRVVENIKQLEQQLVAINEFTKMNEKENEDAEKQIEEHFEKCVNALAARKEALLKELNQNVITQKTVTEQALQDVQKAIVSRKKILETGSFVFPVDANAAENVWKAATTMKITNAFYLRTIKLQLSESLFGAIQSHGKVFLEERECKPQLREKEMLPDSCSFSVIDSRSVFAGSPSSIEGFVDGKGSQSKFNLPRGICWNPYDNCFYVCDKHNDAIRRLTLNGEVSTFVTRLSRPHGIVLYHHTKEFFVTNQGAHSIIKITMEGL